MIPRTPHNNEYIKIDEKSNIDQIGLDYNLSNSAVIGLKKYLKKVKQDRQEDVLYITKEELKEFHGKSVSTRVSDLETHEEQVTDSYEILQHTNLALNLAGGDRDKLAEGRETLQSFSDTVDNMVEDFLFRRAEAPLLQNDLSYIEKKNLITGMSFYVSEQAFGVDGVAEGFNKAMEVMDGGWWNTIMVIGKNLKNYDEKYFAPFENIFATFIGKNAEKMRIAVEGNHGHLTNPFDAKTLIEHVASGKENPLSAKTSKDKADQNKELAKIGAKWETIIDKKNGADITAFTEFATGETGNKSITDNLKLFFSTSMGDKVKGWIAESPFLSMILSGVAMLFGLDMTEILGKDKLDEHSVNDFRARIVKNTENIENADILLATKKGEFDEAVSERLYGLKKDDEDLAKTLVRISEDDDFKLIGKELTSTGNTVDSDGKITMGMNEAINHYYDFTKAQEADPRLTVNAFIKSKKAVEVADTTVDDNKKSDLAGVANTPKESTASVETVTKDTEKISVVSIIEIGGEQRAYNTEIRKDGYIVVRSSIEGELPVKYQIVDANFMTIMRADWDTPLDPQNTDELQSGIKKTVENGIDSTTGKFSRAQNLHFVYQRLKIPLALVEAGKRSNQTADTSNGTDNNTVTAVTAVGAAAGATKQGSANNTPDSDATSTANKPELNEDEALVISSNPATSVTHALEQKPLAKQAEESKIQYVGDDDLDKKIKIPQKEIEVSTDKSEFTFKLNEGIHLRVINDNNIYVRVHEGTHTTVYHYTNTIGTKTSDLVKDVVKGVGKPLGESRIIGEATLKSAKENLTLRKLRETILPEINSIGKTSINLDKGSDKVEYGVLHLQTTYSSKTLEQKEEERKRDKQVTEAEETPAESTENSSGDQSTTTEKTKGDEKEKKLSEYEKMKEESKTAVQFFPAALDGRGEIKGMFEEKEFKIFFKGNEIHIEVTGEQEKYRSVFVNDGKDTLFTTKGDNYDLKIGVGPSIVFDGTDDWFDASDMSIYVTPLIEEIFLNYGNPIKWKKSPRARKDMFFKPYN